MKKPILFITAITLICVLMGASHAQAQEKEKNAPAYEYETDGRGGLIGLRPKTESQKENPPQKETRNPCEGVQVYEEWVLSWSPKTAIVYVRNPEYVDTAMLIGKKARLGFNVGGKVDAASGRDTIHYGIIIPAEQDGQAIVPEKRSLSVDNQIVQEWGTGGGQWAVLSESTMQALFSGTHGEFNTTELGRIRFPLKGLKDLLRLADIEQQQAVVKTELGECVQ